MRAITPVWVCRTGCSSLPSKGKIASFRWRAFGTQGSKLQECRTHDIENSRINLLTSRNSTMVLVVGSLNRARHLSVRLVSRSARDGLDGRRTSKLMSLYNTWRARRRRIIVDRSRLGGAKAKPWSMQCRGCCRPSAPRYFRRKS